MFLKYSAESNKRDMLEDLTRHLESKPSNKSYLLYELAQCISAAIDADHVNVYIHCTEGNITKFAPEDPKEEYVGTLNCKMGNTNLPNMKQ